MWQLSDWSRLNPFSIPFTQSQSSKLKITCALCHELGSDGEAVGEVAFDDGDGLTSAVNGGLLAGVFGDVECRGTGCGLSGIFVISFFAYKNDVLQKKKKRSAQTYTIQYPNISLCPISQQITYIYITRNAV